jgi:predicted transcriptional regulator
MKVTHMLRSVGLGLCAVALGTLQIPPAQAAMVGTESVIQSESTRVSREQLAQLLERDDVRQQLVAMGVDPLAAKQRVAVMTDVEVANLNQRLQDAPAGSDVLGLVVLIFIIFIITDLLGATDVFPFVHPIHR